MKGTTMGIAAAVIIIVLIGAYYVLVPHTEVHRSALLGSTFYYEYIVSVPGKGNYVNYIKLHVIRVNSSVITFNYTITPLNDSGVTYSNVSFVPVFDPTNNLTYFAPYSFGMPMFINTSVRQASGNVYIQFQGGESVSVKYVVSRTNVISVNMTIIPYLYTYNLGASRWSLVYNKDYGYLIYARGSFIGSNYITFVYKLVNESV
ncbi:MAG: hypothetical protein ACP5GH_01295 [Nitrososphaeria archaeon]